MGWGAHRLTLRVRPRQRGARPRHLRGGVLIQQHLGHTLRRSASERGARGRVSRLDEPAHPLASKQTNGHILGLTSSSISVSSIQFFSVSARHLRYHTACEHSGEARVSTQHP